MKRIAILGVLALMLFSVPAFSQARVDNFFVTIGLQGEFVLGGGTGYDNGTWYLYPSTWINEWFYDHPFDPTRGKIIHIEFDWVSYIPGAPTTITVAVNWSTPEWSQLGYGPNLPPTPNFDETLYIRRSGILGEVGYFPNVQHFVYDFTIWPYNPEWVSIDVRGFNFTIVNGTILHDCTIGTEKSTWGSIKADYR